MLSATADGKIREGGKQPRAGESRPALPFPDPWVLVSTVLLLALGLLMVTSASIPLADSKMGQPFYFLIRQSAFVVVGLLAAGVVLQVPLTRWRRAGPLLLLAAMGLLGLVLVPGVGREVNGSMRWIAAGPVNVQVSEIAKLLVLIYVADYLKRHGADLRTGDLRTSVLALLRPMAVLILSSPYRRERLFSFVNPWEDPFGGGFQLVQSLIAIGRGELFGVGLGGSVQKLFYLPEAHTDFLFAVLAEELGLAGILTVLALFMILVWRAFVIARRAERLDMPFSAYLAYGIGLWFGIQALFNMGVNMGVLPTKGLTLPLMSYGGSSVVVMCMALALLLRIDIEIRAMRIRKE